MALKSGIAKGAWFVQKHPIITIIIIVFILGLFYSA